MIEICFVCLGNICRSPTAEGIMQHMLRQAGLAARVKVDSAGTAGYHEGERPDPRTLRTAEARGVSLPSLARKWQRADFERFHYVLAMDRRNLAELHALAASEPPRAKLHLLRSFDPANALAAAAETSDVPDPYYGDQAGFEHVFDVCESACRGLLAHLQRTHGL